MEQEEAAAVEAERLLKEQDAAAEAKRLEKIAERERKKKEKRQ